MYGISVSVCDGLIESRCSLPDIIYCHAYSSLNNLFLNPGVYWSIKILKTAVHFDLPETRSGNFSIWKDWLDFEKRGEYGSIRRNISLEFELLLD